jgi:hypothetical protein
MNRKYTVKQFLNWMAEAQIAHQVWRRESWEDYEFRDGKQWTQSAINQLVKKGIKAITVNRIFPIMNLIMGHFINNQQDIVAKGRTKKDNELGQVMSEAISFIRDQNQGGQKIIRAFNDMITTGVGFLKVDLNPDPRQEEIHLKRLPWHSLWWDPYADPFLDKTYCRYAFTAAWKDLDDLIMVFPDKAYELREQFAQLSSDVYVPDVYDEGSIIEDYKRHMGVGFWTNSERRRVRPAEMWYTALSKSWFAVMPNGKVIDLDSKDEQDQFSLVYQAKEVVAATVKKMRVSTFLDNLILKDIPSPFVHDDYPYSSFVGYLDRYDYPFGIPRQIKEQDMEVNKRRSMALSLISNRRVIVEKGAAEDENTLYREANRSDGFIVLKRGRMKSFEIQEMGQLSEPQIKLLEQSEREVKEIAGANDEALGYETKVQSGVALDNKQQSQATMQAGLLENARYGLVNMGEKITALVQNRWTDEKVMRVTDRVTGVEAFVAINKPIQDDQGNIIEIKNDLTQARFDLKIAAKPMTDTMREKNMELLFSAINKSPAEAVGPLLNLALEISDIPNKDLLLKQVRAATGATPLQDQMSAEEREAWEKEEAQKVQAREEEDYALTIQERKAKNAEMVAKAEELRAKALALLKTADAAEKKVDVEGYKLGQELIESMLGEINATGGNGSGRKGVQSNSTQ